MSIQKQGGRQWPLVAKMAFGYADHGVSGTPEDAVDVPAGASVIRASVTITEAYDSGTSDVLDVAGAGVTLAAVDATALGTTEASAIDSTALTAKGAVSLEWTGAGAPPAQGAGFLLIEYVQEGKADNVQPV